jgi:hypothetical protein
MLYDNPPLYVIKGVSLYPDHEDTLQFYYLPLLPRVSSELQKDREGNRRVIPQLQLILYAGNAKAGGFLNLDVDLGIDEKRLDEIRSELKRKQKLSDLPRLAPVPWVEGTVSMKMFDAVSGEVRGTGPGDARGTGPREARGTEGEARGTAGNNQFVLKISHPAKPALYGENRASFSVALSQDGASLLHQLLDPEAGNPVAMTPVSITYALTYWALRPAYHARVEADWEQVHSRLAKKFQYNSLIFSADIDLAVDEMLNSQEAEKILRVDTFVPESEANKPVLDRRDQAVEELKEMITAAFFAPVANLYQEKRPDMFDRVYDGIKRGAAAIASYGATEIIGAFTFKDINFKQIDTRSLVGDMTERTTVLRQISPQGHLAWVLQELKDQGLDLKSLITPVVDLDDPWFRKRTIKLAAAVDFTKDSIRSIDVGLKYGDKPENVTLTSSSETKEKSWNSVVKNGAMVRDATISYTVWFKDADGGNRPRSLNSPVKVTDSDHITIDPRELYSILEVPITAVDSFWDRYPGVEVQALYVDEGNGIRNEQRFMLDRQHTTTTWSVFQRNPLHKKLQYRVTFRGTSRSQDRTDVWKECDDGRILISDPLPQEKKKTVLLFGFDWAKTQYVSVDVVYEDQANGIKAEKNFEFSSTSKAPQPFVYRPLDADRQTVRYQATIINEDGTVVEIPPSVTNESVVRIQPRARGHRIIRVQPKQEAFATKDLKKLIVEMRYQDPDHPELAAAGEKFEFYSPQDKYDFEFDYASAKKNRYQYRLEYISTTGFSKSTDWVSTEKVELIVPLS